MEKYPILQICRTARFRIDWYIPKPETFCQLSGEMRLCIMTTYLIWETSQFFTLSFHSSLWSWGMIFESGHRRTRWISRKSWTPDYFVSRKVKLLKIIKTDSVINITRVCTEIFPKADTKKRQFLPTIDRYSSVRCVLLKYKARCLKILRKTFIRICFPWIKIPI